MCGGGGLVASGGVGGAGSAGNPAAGGGGGGYEKSLFGKKLKIDLPFNHKPIIHHHNHPHVPL